MIKKLLVFFATGMIFGLQAMQKPVPRRSSPLKQVTTFVEDGLTEDDMCEILAKCQIVRPKERRIVSSAYHFPIDYEKRTYVTQDEWNVLPPEEQKKWTRDKGTPEEDKISLWAYPLSVYNQKLVPAADVKKRFDDFYQKQSVIQHD